MKKGVEIPEIKNYLVFRYNLYMMEFMYEYIVEKMMNKYPIEETQMMKWAFGKDKKELLYKLLNTNRTDFSKYKHSDKIEKPVTKNMRSTFLEYPEFEDFITGERFIIDNTVSGEEYPNEHELELSEDTEMGLIRAVNNAWNIVQDSLEYEKFEGKGLIQKFAGWMIIRILECCVDLKGKKEKIDNVVLKEFEHIDKISFEMLDACERHTLEKIQQQLKKINGKVNTIYSYKTMKEGKK